MLMMCACMACQVKNGVPCLHTVRVPINDSDIYRVECPSGGITILVLQAFRFSLLFEIALLRFAEGAYNDAVIKASTAIERFYEFCTRAAWLDAGFSLDAFDKAFPKGFISKYSEQQFGGYLFATALSHEKSGFLWPKLKKQDDWKNLRNNCVHAGYFPAKEETNLFLTEASRFVLDTIDSLQSERSAIVDSLERFEIRQKHQEARTQQEAEDHAQVSTLCPGFSMPFFNRESGEINIEELANRVLKKEIHFESIPTVFK